ncbi:hypothetical protein GGX14DRAFT_673863 [Mycena pura]|uniref:Uncharacterized protein n=1 Tax=Mycena pura TaxID=153505 RepID=A0AAD6UWH5_9AGAR|nr:hypothetical protein GGX14DRAFT_673863 [Mycena pura]
MCRSPARSVYGAAVQRGMLSVFQLVMVLHPGCIATARTEIDSVTGLPEFDDGGVLYQGLFRCAPPVSGARAWNTDTPFSALR